ncbi:prolyl-tRNA synthetase associated domain-containing protein [Aureimonas sp. AU40]|uniref:prolyl-tRNA synthetase associated domain-containing protein n=1 Tax=Aureimonas sp. AU40 TaxID=1637747 RepID=UPI0009EA7858|nr:prolyl-tRNA synthetase associated domain-containing protein [Aureimonas sp. AU40]
MVGQADGESGASGAALSRDDEALRALAPALAERLASLGIPTRTLQHEPVFTVDESQDLHRAILGAHTKNLFLKDKKSRLFLVVAEHSTAVDLKGLHTRIGAQGRLSFGSPEQMRERLGVEPGSVTAFGIVNDGEGAVTLVLDERLLQHDILNCHPLTNRGTTSIARDHLLALFASVRHDPLVVRLEADTAELASGQTS